MTVSPFGLVLREWRRRRGLSQFELAERIGTSSRHISFVETGRSRPGRDLVVRIAEGLDIPHRDRNALLAAAGLAPMYPETPLEAVDLEPYRRAVEAVLERHEPYPACALDRWGGVLVANHGARRFAPGIEEVTPEQHVDALLGPGPARDVIVNWEEVAWSYFDRLSRSAIATSDQRLLALVEQARSHLEGTPRPSAEPIADAARVVHIDTGEGTLSVFTTVMRFEGARDVTLSEVSVELLFPLDAATASFFEAPPSARR